MLGLTGPLIQLAASAGRPLLYTTIFVVGLVVYAVAMFFLTSERWKNVVRILLSGLLILVTGSFVSEISKKTGGVISTVDKYQPISDGISIKLNDVFSLRGWGEGKPEPNEINAIWPHGDHKRNMSRGSDDIDFILKVVLKEIQESEISVDDWINFDQNEWEQFLHGLSKANRDKVGGIAFAYISIQDGGKEIELPPQRSGIVDLSEYTSKSGFLEIEQIYNTLEGASGTPEAIKYNYRPYDPKE